MRTADRTDVYSVASRKGIGGTLALPRGYGSRVNLSRDGTQPALPKATLLPFLVIEGPLEQIFSLESTVPASLPHPVTCLPFQDLQPLPGPLPLAIESLLGI